jgi:hypothetical protein
MSPLNQTKSIRLLQTHIRLASETSKLPGYSRRKSYKLAEAIRSMDGKAEKV